MADVFVSYARHDKARVAPPSLADGRRLHMKAREAKELLSTAEEAPIHLRLASGEEIDLVISRDEFVEITRHLAQKTLVPVRKALRDAGLGPEDVKGVVMVGGATRMTHIQRAVADYFGQEALNATRFFDTDWPGARWSHGGPVGIAGTGLLTSHGPALRAPVGPLHWAGTETSNYWNGYMDGAVRSGKIVTTTV